MEENIKKCWQSTSFNTNGCPETNPRRHTALQALADRYRKFSRLSFIFAMIFPIWGWSMLHRWTDGMGWQTVALTVYSIAYFITAGLMDRWLARGVSSIDIAEMPVAEVCRKTVYYRKKHFLFMAILLPMAILLVAGLAFILSADRYFIYGIATGVVAGLIIGLIVLSDFMRDYRDIMKD